jgi:hypothetical protein
VTRRIDRRAGLCLIGMPEFLQKPAKNRLIFARRAWRALALALHSTLPTPKRGSDRHINPRIEDDITP